MLRGAASALLRGNLKAVLGYIRYLHSRPRVHDFHDFSILQLLICECGLPLDKTTLNRLLDRNPTIVEFGDGTRYVVMDLEDFYHASMCYEAKTLAFILKQLENGGVFVDVGANIGGYSVRCAKKARVWAIEPHPRNFQLLELNVRLNHLQNNVRALRVAVASSLGKAELFISNYHGRHSLICKDGGDTIKRRTIEVDVVPLDLLLADEDHIDVIKIDVEGAEPLVLKGARGALKRTKVVVVEAAFPGSFSKAFKILAMNSFKAVKRLDGNVVFVKA
jgi:FkbM family methyltransferase